MRQLDDLRITIKNATPLNESGRVNLAIPGDNMGEIWIVPAMFEAECDDDALPYRVRFAVKINPATSVAEIARLDIYQLIDGEPVHAAGLRHLPLAAILRAAVYEAATFYEMTESVGGYVETLPAPRLTARSVARATDRRAGAKNRKNSPSALDAEWVIQTVADFKRRGVRDWVDQACKVHGMSRATLYRRIKLADKSNPPKTKKRGKR